MKREIVRGGYTVVLDDGGVIDERREFILSSIDTYSMLCERQVKIVFFNREDGREKGVTFLWR